MPPQPPPNQFSQFPQNPSGVGPGGQQVGGPRQQNILRQHLRGQQQPGVMQNQNFQGQQGQPGIQPNPNQQGMMFQQQQQQGMQFLSLFGVLSVQFNLFFSGGMNQNYAFNQPNMGAQGSNINPNVMNQQPQTNVQLNQMLGARGVVSGGGAPPNQDISNFMQQGGVGVGGQQRPQMVVGQQRTAFMQQQQGVGVGGPQGQMAYRMQMGGGGGVPPGQMGMQNPNQMGQGMVSGGGMQPNQMNQMGNQVGGMGPGMQQGQMGGQMQQNPNMTGVQRVRQFVMQQQQQQQQGMGGMGGGPQRMQYQNQGPGPGGYWR